VSSSRRAATSSPQTRGLDKRADPCQGATYDQGIDLSCALVRVDGLGIGDEAPDLFLQKDAIAAEQLAGEPTV
jgi:hypothetical protein